MGTTATGICPTDSMDATAATEYPAAPVGMAWTNPNQDNFNLNLLRNTDRHKGNKEAKSHGTRIGE